MFNVEMDFRYAVRTLLRSPGFLIAAVLSLGLGIGANTAIFSITNAVFLHPMPPVDNPNRVLEIFTVDHATPTTAPNQVRTGVSLPNTQDIIRQNGAFSGIAALLTAFREGDPLDSNLGVLTITPPVSPGYFDTIRVPIVEGRDFTEFDRATATKVTIVSQSTASRLWPGRSAIGKRVYFAASPGFYQVVGIARDRTLLNIAEPPQMIAYMPFDQAYQPAVVLHVRTVGNPQRIIAPLTTAIQSVNSELALNNPGDIQSVISQALWPPRIAAILFGIFGIPGLVLAVIGVYGVMAYTILQRTSEIGIRVAVGARPLSVIAMIRGHSIKLALAGIALGLLGALAITGPVRNLLFDVSPSDPATFLIVAAVLAATALAAGGIPASRASHIDPVLALRQE